MNVVNAHTPARDQDAGDAGRDLQSLRSAGRPSRQQDALVQRREASCLRGLVWRLAASVAALSPAMAAAGSPDTCSREKVTMETDIATNIATPNRFNA